MKKFMSFVLFACLGVTVISCGGDGDVDPSNSTSATGTFSATGMMTSPRSMPTANVLLDGRVFVAGG